MKPPIELPTTTAASIPRAASSPSRIRAYPAIEISCRGIGERPKPGRSSARTRWLAAKSGSWASQFCQEPDRPCTNTIAGSPAPSSIVLTGWPSMSTQR
jgi:hypothetical protein